MIGKLMNSLVKRVLARRGMCAVPLTSRLSLAGALAKWSHREINTVIDVGASDGRWTKDVLPFFPQANFLLVEAQGDAHGAKLEAFRREHPNVDYLIAAAGDRQGKIYFDAGAPLGGAASETPFEQNNIEVPVTTIDAAVAERGLEPPYLLKLDTHGFEVPIFEGAAATMADTSLIIVEVYNFTLCDGALRFHEMCGYLEQRGFRPLDLFDVMHREKDGALWQFDLLLGRTTDAEFSTNSYE